MVNASDRTPLSPSEGGKSHHGLFERINRFKKYIIGALTLAVGVPAGVIGYRHFMEAHKEHSSVSRQQGVTDFSWMRIRTFRSGKDDQDKIVNEDQENLTRNVRDIQFHFNHGYEQTQQLPLLLITATEALNDEIDQLQVYLKPEHSATEDDPDMSTACNVCSSHLENVLGDCGRQLEKLIEKEEDAITHKLESALANAKNRVEKVRHQFDVFKEQHSSEVVEKRTVNTDEALHLAEQSLLEKWDIVEFTETSPLVEMQYRLNLTESELEKLPSTFGEFLTLLKSNADYRKRHMHTFERCCMNFRKVKVQPEYMVHFNSKLLTSAYCLLTKTTDVTAAWEVIRNALGDKCAGVLQAKHVDIDWDKKKTIMTLAFDDTTVSVPLLHNADQGIALPQQNVPLKKLNAHERQRWSRRYAGKVELVDNAVGKITELTVGTRDVPSVSLTALMESFDESVRFNFLRHPPLFNIVQNSPETTQNIEEAITQTHDQVRSTIGDRVHIANPKSASEWVRDYFLQARDPRSGRRLILVSDTANQLHGEKLRSEDFGGGSTMPREQQIPFMVDGGDMRAVGPYLFVGEKYMERAIMRYTYIYTLPNGEVITNESGHKNDSSILSDFSSALRRYEGNGPNWDWAEGEEKVKAALKIESYYQIKGKRISTANLSKEEAMEMLLREMGSYFGREVYVVGHGDDAEQAIFHLDMFTTYLPNADEKPTVVIGDIKRTRQLLSSLTPQQRDVLEKQSIIANVDPDSFKKKRVEEERRRLERPDLPISMYGARVQDNLSIIRDVEQRMESYIEDLQSGKMYRNLEKNLDAATKWFTARGFIVERIPIEVEHISRERMLVPERDRIEVWGGPDRTVWATASNALVEVYMGGDGKLRKIIRLPVFGNSVLTNDIIQTYNRLGYEVIPIPGLKELSERRGVLDCITSEYRMPFGE